MGRIWRRSLAPGAVSVAKKAWRQARAEILWWDWFQARVFAPDRRRRGEARGDSMFLGQPEEPAAACALAAAEKRAALAWVKRSVARNRAGIPRRGQRPSTRCPTRTRQRAQTAFCAALYSVVALPPEKAKNFLPAPAARRAASLAQLLVAKSRLAKVARLAALGADNFRFDHEVVGSPDHQQVFDVVASNNNELALPVEVEGIDGSKPRQPGPSITWQPKPASEGGAENNGQHASGDEECDRLSGNGETLLAKKLSFKPSIWWLIRRKQRRRFV